MDKTPPILRKRDEIRDSYTSVTENGCRTEFNVWLKVGGQTFSILTTACGSREEAEWYREQLASALLQIVREQEKGKG